MTRRGGYVVLVLTVLVLALTVEGELGTAVGKARKLRGLHVIGNRLVDGKGRRLILRGVNRSGTEYACIQGWGIFDGPSGVRSVEAIAAWHVNFVRIPLNEDCWLGISGVKPGYGGISYRRAILRYVALLHRHGIYVEVSLMWAAPGHYRATYQPGGPDADHAPAMWSSMARAFKDDPNVVLAPWGETMLDSGCFLRGGCGARYGSSHTPYRTAGMQQAVDLMRTAGYPGVIAVPGVGYANYLSQWLAYEPHDKRHQLIAEAHVYGKNVCSSISCLNRTMAPVTERVPLIFGETGETYDDSSCGSSNISSFLHWADAHDVGYAAWTWDAWGNCEALIRNYAGSPANQYGSFVRSYYTHRASGTRRLGS